MIIDWVDATQGPVGADVIRTVLLVRFCEVPVGKDGAEAFRRMRTTFLEVYQARYLTVRSLPYGSFREWTPVIAGARLSEDITCAAARNALVALAREGKQEGCRRLAIARA
jgi:hypothetical protein